MATSRSCLGNFTLILIVVGVGLAVYYNNFHCMSNINDSEGDFTSKQRCVLNSTMAEYEKSSGNKICVVTMKPDGSYSTPVKCKVTIVCSKTNRKININVGYGLRDKLTDEKVQQIINNTMIPYFEDGNFYGGIRTGITSIIRVLEHRK